MLHYNFDCNWFASIYISVSKCYALNTRNGWNNNDHIPNSTITITNCFNNKLPFKLLQELLEKKSMYNWKFDMFDWSNKSHKQSHSYFILNKWFRYEYGEIIPLVNRRNPVILVLDNELQVSNPSSNMNSSNIEYRISNMINK